MLDLTKYRPAYLEFITRNINSCVNAEQMHICWDIIHLFEMRFSGLVPTEALVKDVKVLTDIYFKKESELLIPKSGK